MREANVLGKRSVGFFMGQVVGDVGEESSLGFEFFHQPQRVGNRGMGGMGPVAERIQKQNIEKAEQAARKQEISAAEATGVVEVGIAPKKH